MIIKELITTQPVSNENQSYHHEDEQFHRAGSKHIGHVSLVNCRLSFDFDSDQAVHQTKTIIVDDCTPRCSIGGSELRTD